MYSAVPHEVKRNRLSPNVAVGSRVALRCRSPVPHETADHASLWLPDSRLGRVGDHTSVRWQDWPIRKTAHRTTLLCDCLFLIGKAGDHTSLWLGYAQIGRRQTALLCGCPVPQSGSQHTTPFCGRFATLLCHHTRHQQGDSRTPLSVLLKHEEGGLRPEYVPRERIPVSKSCRPICQGQCDSHLLSISLPRIWWLG